MRKMLTAWLLVAQSTAITGALAQGQDGVVALTLMPEGASKRTPGTMLNRALLSSTKPETLKKAPDGLSSPLYAAVPIAGKTGATYLVIVDEPEGHRNLARTIEKALADRANGDKAKK